MASAPTKTSDSDMVRARVDQTLKEQWEQWCVRANVTPSQVLRWLIQMHLHSPHKLWEFLAVQTEKEVSPPETSSGEAHDDASA